MAVAFGLLRKIGIEVLDPRPTDNVSRPNEITAGTPELLTVIPALFDVIAPLTAVMLALPSATPVTTPEALTVATPVADELYVNTIAVLMNRPFASRPLASSGCVPVGAIVAAAGVRLIDASTCDTTSDA